MNIKGNKPLSRGGLLYLGYNQTVTRKSQVSTEKVLPSGSVESSEKSTNKATQSGRQILSDKVVKSSGGCLFRSKLVEMLDDGWKGTCVLKIDNNEVKVMKLSFLLIISYHFRCIQSFLLRSPISSTKWLLNRSRK